VDAAGRRVVLADGEIGYDTLLVATGAANHYFGRPEWARAAPGLKTLGDATEMRRRILLAFEAAETARTPEEVREWLTFVVVGGGPTGVELAGALGEISRYTLRREFRAIDPGRARILLVEGSSRVLPSFPPGLAGKAARALARLGVEVRAETFLEEIGGGAVRLRTGDRVEEVRARTVLWAAGVRASPFGEVLARAAGAPLDASGRVRVGPDLSIPGRPEILVLGDLALVPGPDGRPLPGVAPVAIQEGRYAAHVVRERLRGRSPRPFRYSDAGTLATIGRAAAVAEFGSLRLSGFPAWLLWLFVHLMNLVQFEAKVLVLFQWAWNYLTFGRTARLILDRSVPYDGAPTPWPR